MGRRLFESLEQGVEGLRCEHVDFVDVVDFESASAWRELDVVAKLADFIDASIARTIDFQDVEIASIGDLAADVFVRIEVEAGAACAVECLSEDSGGGGLSDASWAYEEVGMGEPVLLDGVAQGLHDVVLSEDVIEGLRPVFACENLIAH